jgi:hypothetical protein
MAPGRATQFYDYHWPIVLGGFRTINPDATDPRAGSPDGSGGIAKVPGDWRETMSTHWFHDHMFANKGQYFFANRCAACHSIGHGERVGPDLAGVTRRRDQAWLKRYLAAPDRMLAGGDPIARSLDARYGSAKMPNLRMGEADVTALVDYLAEQEGPAVTSAVHAPHAVRAADGLRSRASIPRSRQ